MVDITADDGAKIVAEAKSWKGTSYKSVGAGSIKGESGDCSGSTWRIYEKVGYVYAFQSTAAFPGCNDTSKKFRELAKAEKSQEGDLLYWNGHMAVYSSFASDTDNAITPRMKGEVHFKQINDMWTATHPGGPPYQPHKISWFKGGAAPRIFRFQK